MGPPTISIHALLAESDFVRCIDRTINIIFLSTLSLRRATGIGLARMAPHTYFYPRSPCGERHTWARGSRVTYVISIHALLAESDTALPPADCLFFLFLSTLSLRRATHWACPDGSAHLFLSTLSLRRATITITITCIVSRFLSTLSLRRATL